MALINKLEAIGDAIREKTGETAKLSLDDMATAITNISTGSEPNLGNDIEFYENGTYDAEAYGYDGFKSIYINVEAEPAEPYLISFEATENGNYHPGDIEPGAEGFSEVYVNVASGSLQTAVITAEGNRFYLDNYIAPGDNFILFYTAYSGSGNFVRSMWMPDWSKYIYNLAPNVVSGDSAYINAGIKQLQTSLIDVSNTMSTLSNKTNSTIEFDGKSFAYFSDTSCKVGRSAVLVYVG